MNFDFRFDVNLFIKINYTLSIIFEYLKKFENESNITIICILCVNSILSIRNSNSSTMRLYGIDINPMKPFEFIVNGDDEYVRMYDKRNLGIDPVKLFHRVLPTSKVYIYILIKNIN